MKRLCILIILALLLFPTWASPNALDPENKVKHMTSMTTASLVTLLKDKSSFVRSMSILNLEVRGDKTVLDPLKVVLTDPSEYVRVSAAIALAKLGDPSGNEILRKAVTKDNPQTFSAAYELLKQGDETGLEIVKSKLTSSISIERALALGAITCSKDQELIYSSIDRGLFDADQMIRLQSIGLLGAIGTERSMDRLKTHYPSLSSDMERAHALKAAVKTKLWSSVPLLIQGLDDSGMLTRIRASLYLNAITGENMLNSNDPRSFNVNDPENFRELAKQWQQWWEDNKAQYPTGSKTDVSLNLK